MAGDRNPLDLEYVEARDDMAQQGLEVGIEFLGRRPRNSSGVVDDAEIRFACAAVLGPEADSFAVVDRDALDRLAAVPVDVIRGRTSRSPEYSYLYVTALQAFWRKDADTIDRFMAALEATDSDGPSAHRRREPEGWVATGLLAVACLAHDAGMRVDVQSDYLPARLVHGT